MKGRILLGLVLAAVIVVSVVEVIGTEKVSPVDPDISAGNSCVTDADCTGNRICCAINWTCTTPRNCRKDPLQESGNSCPE